MENQQKYISLQEATKLCDYSQEYLSLRARQKKLKAMKIGRNWATTEQWIKEYLSRDNNIVNTVNQEIKKEEQSAVKIIPQENKITEKIINPPSVLTDVLKDNQKEILPPQNLPTTEFSALNIGAQPVLLKQKIRIGFVFGLVLSLLIFGAVLGKKDITNAYNSVNLSAGKNFAETFSNFSDNIRDISKDTTIFLKEKGVLLLQRFQKDPGWVAEKSGLWVNRTNNWFDNSLSKTAEGVMVFGDNLNSGLEKSVISVGEFFVNTDISINNYIDNNIGALGQKAVKSSNSVGNFVGIVGGSADILIISIINSSAESATDVAGDISSLSSVGNSLVKNWLARIR